MKTGCFVCPIYDKENDFDYALTLFKSAISYNIQESLYFVFSGEQQKNKFVQMAVEYTESIPCFVVMEENLSDCKNPVSIKKYYGIKQIFHKFDYIAAIDCECTFCRKFNPGEVMHEIWVSGSMLASNKSVRGAYDVRVCGKALGFDKFENVVKETVNFSYTWWFNEIPVYNCSNLEEFFGWLESEYYQIVYNEWCCFDYLVYGMWLIAYKGHSLKKYNYKTDVGLIETLWKPYFPHKRKIEIDFETHWTSNTKVNINNKNLCVQFHLDRRGSYLRLKAGMLYHKIRVAILNK